MLRSQTSATGNKLQLNYGIILKPQTYTLKWLMGFSSIQLHLLLKTNSKYFLFLVTTLAVMVTTAQKRS